MNLFDLSGKVAVVTGSSRGIGKAIAEQLAAAGARVVISSRNQPACDAVAEAINADYGPGTALAIAASISSKAALEDLIEKSRSGLGEIDILVCNAASNPHYGPLLTITDDQFRKIFENNVLSNHWLISLVVPGMVERGGGAIIIVSSIGGLLGSDLIGGYNISKAADFQLVRNLAVELGPRNIRINAIAPGVTRTDFAKALYEEEASARQIVAATPLRRIAEPVDMAGAVHFLASGAAAHMTGQTIVIDGGITVAGVK